MQRSKLGVSGVQVSRIGLGLAALGRPGYINIGHASDLAGRTDEISMELTAHAVLDAALSRGVRYFDAARSYGMAEAFLGAWLTSRRLESPEVVVGSKWGYTYTAKWQVDVPVHEVKDLSVTTLRRQVQETSELLGRNLCLYQIHSATTESGVLEDAAVREELDRLRQGGLLIGITVTGPKQTETIKRALDVGGFDVVQATWNLLDRSAGNVLAEAHGEGLGVIVKEALANGRLTSRGDIWLLCQTAEEIGATPDALALSVALSQPWADVVLSGAATVDELSSNLAALQTDVAPRIMERLESLTEDPVEYWQTRSSLPWN